MSTDQDEDVAGATGYEVNTTLHIREHLPPEPFTGDYGPNPRPPVDWSRWKGRYWDQRDRVEFALANPPLETEPPGFPRAHHDRDGSQDDR